MNLRNRLQPRRRPAHDPDQPPPRLGFVPRPKRLDLTTCQSLLVEKHLAIKQPVPELGNGLLDGEVLLDKQRLAGRQVETLRPRDEPKARGGLIRIVGRATSRLEAITEVHEEQEAAEASELARRLSFDDSPEGEQLRQYQMYCGRSMLRAFDTLLKNRKAGDGPQPATHTPSTDRSHPI